ncbi:ketopantoate reductase family protein [Paralcaligenes ginsengisoli]
MNLSNNPSPRIAVVGAGAVGGWVGGKLAQAGFDVTLIDPWPEHVSAMQERGIILTESGRDARIPLRALHIGQVQSLYKDPIDLAFVCVKLYDTGWAAELIAPYLSASGYIVTLQNSLVEERIAAVVGWGRTVGCVGGGMYVGLDGPGHVARTRHQGKSASQIFYAGEAHGRVTPRVRQLAKMLSHVDAAGYTTNLWGLRWSKLVANAMTSALCAACGLSLKGIFSEPESRQLMLRLAGEAIDVGKALGYTVEPVFGVAADRWMAAAAGDAQCLVDVEAAFHAQAEVLTEASLSGTAQDIAKGRRTEIDYMNGYVFARAIELGINTPTHVALTTLIKKMERGQACPGKESMGLLWAE